MSITEFELPEELQTETYESILAYMLNEIDKKYDTTEGGFIYDMVAPSALEAAELLQLWLPLGIKTNFHMWAEDIWLDRHAHDCGLERRPATYAYGDLEVTTRKNVKFPAGFVFCVPGDDGEPAIDFETLEDVEVNGTATIRVKAVEAGIGSNVAADSITIMKNPKKHVASITNLEPTSGGTPEESDDSLRQRIDDFYAGRGSSFVGNVADYRRWALSVAGVGYVHVIPTPDNQPNTVHIVLADSNGEPAVQEICDAVELYIFGEDHNDLKRLAPIGVAGWKVFAFKTVSINISIEAELTLDADVVKENIKNDMQDYFKILAGDELYYGELKYVQVSAVLSKVVGLDDFKHLRISRDEEVGSLNNISFSETEMPIVGTITFT